MSKLARIKSECRENPGLVGLAVAGASIGVFREFVQPKLTAKRGWLAIAAGVVAYELACPKGELLSEGGDRLIERHKTVGKAAIVGTGLVLTGHIANVFPENRDPVSFGLRLLKGD
jgi:hypothetical protein